MDKAIAAIDHLVAALWSDLGQWPIVAQKLKPSEVPDTEAGLIYKVIAEQAVGNLPVLGLVEAEALRRGVTAETIMRLGFRSRHESPTALEAYAAEIKNAAQLKKLADIGKWLADEALRGEGNADEIKAGLLRMTITDLGGSQELRPISDFAEQAEQDFEKWMEGFVEGRSTGFAALDETYRLVKSELTLIAGRPGSGKCLGKGTKVVKYDGSLCKVEDLVRGDLLMGPDSRPRKVLSLARGREMMYWVRQNKGIDYRVNESHILSLKRSRNEGGWTKGDIINVPVLDYINSSGKFKSNFKGYKVSVDFPEFSLPVDPYYVGLWLGDGVTSKSNIVCKPDAEIYDFLSGYAEELGLRARNTETDPSRCPAISIVKNENNRRPNKLIDAMSSLGFDEGKFIPDMYIANSKENRLRLLAGLLDTDGYYDRKKNSYEITQVNERLAYQIKYLADTLGFRTSIHQKTARIKSIGYECQAWRVLLHGNLEIIPTKLPRRQARPCRMIVDWRVTGIQVERDIVDDYYGFELSGDGLFLLEDMTVTHNTSLTWQFVLNVAEEMQQSGEDGVIAVFSADMSGRALLKRAACSIAEVDSRKARRNQITKEEEARVRSAIKYLKTLPILIDDSPSPTTDNMYYRMLAASATHPVVMMMFDFAELGGDEGDTEELRLSNIAKSLRNICKRLDIPVVVDSQLGRKVDERTDKIPTMGDLRYSGMLEQVADNILLIMRPEYYLKRSMQAKVFEPGDEEGVAYVIHAKGRNDGMGFYRLKFVEYLSRFENHPRSGTVRQTSNKKGRE